MGQTGPGRPAHIPTPPTGPSPVLTSLAKEGPAALLSRYTADPSAFTKLVPSATAQLHRLDGKGLANLLGTAALLRTWDAGLFQQAGPLLRSLTFDETDQLLLAQICLALADHAPHLAPAIPRDITAHCLRVHNTVMTRLQPIYDIIALALRRSGLPYRYRTIDPGSGLLVWIELPTPATTARLDAMERAPRAGGGASSPSLGMGALPPPPLISYYALEVGGEWDTIPGTTDEEALAFRLYRQNLGTHGIGIIRMTSEERGRFLGPSAMSGIDLRPGDPGYEDRFMEGQGGGWHHQGGGAGSRTDKDEGGGFPSAASSARWQSPLRKAKEEAAREAEARRERVMEEEKTTAGFSGGGNGGGPRDGSPHVHTVGAGESHIPPTRAACRTLADFVAWSAYHGVGQGTRSR